MLKLLMSLVAALLIPAMVQAQISVSISDVTTDGTRVESLAVNGSIETPAAGLLLLEFRFDAQVFEVLDVSVADGDLLQCSPVTFDSRLDGLDPSIGLLTIECDDFTSGAGRFLSLSIRSLRSSALEGEIRLEAARFNDEALIILENFPGQVIVTSDPVVFEDAESLGTNFPNPFFTSTEFQYTLTDDNVEVRFTVFTFSGMIVFAETVVGQQGINRWKFDPVGMELFLAQGMYLLLMETPNGVYTLPFQHLR